MLGGKWASELKLHAQGYTSVSLYLLTGPPSSPPPHDHGHHILVVFKTTPISPQQQSAVTSGGLRCHGVSHISGSVFPTAFHPNPLHPKHLPGLISTQTGYCISFLSMANQIETSWVCFLTPFLGVLTAFQSRHHVLTTAAISEVLTVLVHRILTAAVQWGWWCRSYFTSDPRLLPLPLWSCYPHCLNTFLSSFTHFAPIPVRFSSDVTFPELFLIT